ncbi:TPA: hypothetical protein ACH3X2_011368 [Trebouxia sp. C0005]
MFVCSLWQTLLRPLVGPTSRWRQQTRSLLALLVFAAIVFHQLLTGPCSIHQPGVIFPSWSGREPTLLARLHPRSSLTSWVGPEAVPDFPAGQSSRRVMPRFSNDLHAPQSTATAMTLSSGLLEVAPTLSASTLGRFQPQGQFDPYFGRVCQACCKPHDLQQQQAQLGWSFDVHFQVLTLHSPHTSSPVRSLFSVCLSSDNIRNYLASHRLSAQQLLLHQAEYAYAISVFRFASLDLSIRQAQGQYAAQCLSAWRGQRTTLVQLLLEFFLAPGNSTRSNPQQRLPGMSGLVMNSMSSSPSAWVWSHTTCLATSVGRPAAESVAPTCKIQDSWDQVCTAKADFTSATQFCRVVPGSSSPITVQPEPCHQHNGIPKGSTSLAQDNTRPTNAHLPDVHVSNVTLDIITGITATPQFLQGVPMTVQQEPRQAHNGISTSFTAWDNNVSWCLNLTSSGFGLNTIIAALPAEELCMIEGFQEIDVPQLTSHMHSGAPMAVPKNHTFGVLLMLLPALDSSPHNRTTITAGNVKRAPFALGSLLNCMSIHVQGLMRHMHSGTSRTILFTSLHTTITDGTPLANCNQRILHDCTHLGMQVVLNTTAVALHPDVLQQHPLTAIRMHHSLEEDAHPALWTVALLISFTLHLLLVALQKSGCISPLPGPQVDWTTGVYRGAEIGATHRVLNRGAEENNCAWHGGKPADSLTSSPRQLSEWCALEAELVLKGHIHRFRQ